MDYTLRELECFTAVAEELSFTRAARRLRLAQPPLSRHIRTLEEKIGTALFNRTQRTVALTAAGALFYDETRGLLTQLVRAGDAAKRSALGETQRLRLGFVSAVLSSELVDVLRVFRRENPAVQILLQDQPPAAQLEAISRGLLDGGFPGLAPRDRPAGVTFLRWRTEELACFVPAGHALSERTSISLKEVKGEAFVAITREAAPAFAAHVQGLCRDAGFRPRVVLESPRAQAVAVMVAAGSGIALLPVSLARVVGNAAVAVPFKKASPIAHVFAHTSGPLIPAMKAFVAVLGR